MCGDTMQTPLYVCILSRERRTLREGLALEGRGVVVQPGDLLERVDSHEDGTDVCLSTKQKQGATLYKTDALDTYVDDVPVVADLQVLHDRLLVQHVNVDHVVHALGQVDHRGLLGVEARHGRVQRRVNVYRWGRSQNGLSACNVCACVARRYRPA